MIANPLPASRTPLLGLTPDPPPAASYLRRFAVRTRRRIDFLAVDQVDWIAAGRGFVTLHAGSERFRLHRQLGELERELDPRRFLRIHRSTIVNLTAVARLESDAHGDLTVVVREERLDVGRQRIRRVRAALLR